jgi:hypothetical protein
MFSKSKTLFTIGAITLVMLAFTISANAQQVLNIYQLEQASFETSTDSEKLNEGTLLNNPNFKARPINVTRPESVMRRRKIESNHFRFGISYGMGYRTQKVNPGYEDIIKNYEEKLNLGQVLSVSLTGGASGLYYSRFATSNRIGPFQFEDEDGYSYIGDIANDIVVHTGMLKLGGGIAFQDFPSILYLSTGFGVSFYNNEAEFGAWYHMEGIGFGFLLDASYDIVLTDFLCLGISATLPRGKITNGNYKDENNDVNGKLALKIGRFDATIGLVYTIP